MYPSIPSPALPLGRCVLLMLAAVALLGCESMSAPQCKVADWYRVGLADGAGGERDSRIADYTEDCAKAGVTPNAPLYRRGWDAGIQQFCTAANGWREGVQGHSGKSSVCLGQVGYSAFSHYFDAGMQVHRVNAQMQHNAQESYRLQQRLESSKNDEEAKNLRQDLRHIDREQSQLRNNLIQLQMLAP
ncbi:MAG: DUF2799 domain-containing protein [Burkholderiales bacterium]|nr:DUF2799 domain-containing protein [Burkholderiales bacterium]